MKNTIGIWLLVAGIAGIAGVFVRGQDVPPASTPIIGDPPPLGVLDLQDPRVQAFVQAGQLTEWMEQSLATLATNQAADEAKLAAIGAGAPGPEGPMGPQGVPGPIGVQGPKGDAGAAVSLPAYSVPAGFTIQFLAQQGGCSAGTLGNDSGTLAFSSPLFCDYAINIPQDGSYVITTHMQILAGVAPVKFHFEIPIGSPVVWTTATSVTWTPPNNSYQFVRSAAIALTHSTQVLRLVVDMPEPASSTTPIANRINWISLTKQ